MEVLERVGTPEAEADLARAAPRVARSARAYAMTGTDVASSDDERMSRVVPSFDGERSVDQRREFYISGDWVTRAARS